MTVGTLGFIGLGVMGEPMCRNLAAKSGRTVIAHDIDPAPVARLETVGAEAARRMLDAAREAGHGANYFPALFHVVNRA